MDILIILELNQGPARHFELFNHHQVDKMLWSGQSVKWHEILHWGQGKKEDAEYLGKEIDNQEQNFSEIPFSAMTVTWADRS